MKFRNLFLMAFAAVSSFAVAQDAKEPEAIYACKSGIVTMEMDMMGNKIVTQTYFDDFGRKTATVNDFGGMKSRSIVINGETIMVNDEQKTATKFPAGMGGFGGNRNSVNFTKLTKEVMDANKIKEVGKETIADKECTVYEMEVAGMMGGTQKTKVWIYKGITLKSSTESDFGTMEQVCSKFEENVEIQASMFTLPEGVEPQEMDMNMFGGGF